jgi:CheY-like chemotaxis protein
MADAVPRPTLLVVEDNEAAREGLAFVLRRAGFNVLTAADGRRALQLLWSEPPPEVILLDMLLPVLDGWHFLERLRRGGPHPPIIVTTATFLSREWAKDHGCAGFLRKPVDEEALLAEVRRCMG